MTFREIAIWADGVNERRREEWKDQLTAAWWNARYSRVPLPEKGKADPFPSLESILGEKTSPRSLTRKQKAAVLKDRLASLERRHNKRFKKKKAGKK